MDKKEVVQRFLDKSLEQIEHYKKAVEEVQNAANSETKSSAGDKYETGRAMAQNDRDLLLRQLLEAEGALSKLNSISWDTATDSIQKGTLVQTNKGWFLIGVGLGKVNVGSTFVQSMSEDAPLAAKLLGKKVGDIIAQNALSFQVLQLL